MGLHNLEKDHDLSHPIPSSRYISQDVDCSRRFIALKSFHQVKHLPKIRNEVQYHLLTCNLQILRKTQPPGKACSEPIIAIHLSVLLQEIGAVCGHYYRRLSCRSSPFVTAVDTISCLFEFIWMLSCHSCQTRLVPPIRWCWPSLSVLCHKP